MQKNSNPMWLRHDLAFEMREAFGEEPKMHRIRFPDLIKTMFYFPDGTPMFLCRERKNADNISIAQISFNRREFPDHTIKNIFNKIKDNTDPIPNHGWDKPDLMICNEFRTQSHVPSIILDTENASIKGCRLDTSAVRIIVQSMKEGMQESINNCIKNLASTPT